MRSVEIAAGQINYITEVGQRKAPASEMPFILQLAGGARCAGPQINQYIVAAWTSVGQLKISPSNAQDFGRLAVSVSQFSEVFGGKFGKTRRVSKKNSLESKILAGQVNDLF
jgi:hypothetical protein